MSQREQWDPGSVTVAQHAIVLALLRTDHEERWSLNELRAEIHDMTPEAVSGALAILERQRVVVRTGEHVLASRSAWHMNELGMVAV